MGNNYMIALNNEWCKLIKLCPKGISERLNVEYDNKKNQFTILYYQQYYIIDISNKVIFNNITCEQLDITNSIIVLNYLTYSSSNVEVTDVWVSLKDLPNGGALFYPAFYKTSEFDIIKKFGNDILFFEKSSSNLNGKPIKYGSMGFVFNVLPKVKIAVILWEGDDEISPSVSFLFESSIQYLLHIETIITVGINLANRLTDIKLDD